MGKKTKRRSGGANKRPIATGSATTSAVGSSTARNAHSGTTGADLERAAAVLSLDPRGNQAELDCTNAEVLERIEAPKRVQVHPKRPKHWHPQTPEEWRQLMDEHIDFFDMERLVSRENPLESLRLSAFRDYAINLIQNIRGLTNVLLQENFRLAGLPDGSILFPGAIPVCTVPFPLYFPGALPQDMTFPLTHKDNIFLHAVIKANESPIYVAHANLALGCWYKCLKHDEDKGIFCFQSSVQVCDSASKEEQQRTITGLKPIAMTNGKTQFFCTVGEYLLDIREQSYDQVLFARSTREIFMKPYSKDDENGGAGTGIPGDQCDGCRKLARDTTVLCVCNRCRRTYYCSKECQIAHWKKKPDGHKQSCRKKNEFRQGDKVTTLQRYGKVKPGSTVVLLEPREECKWLVCSLHHGIKCVLSAKQLRIIPHSDKRFNDAVDSALFGRTFG